MNKLWLDDVRKPPDDSWSWRKSMEEAKQFVMENECDEWALDHDLGGQLAHYGTGVYDHAAATGFDFVKACLQFLPKPPKRVWIHSTNTTGAIEMAGLLYVWAAHTQTDIEIILKPMLGRIIDMNPYYDPKLRAKTPVVD